jgi:hypothetical protein
MELDARGPRPAGRAGQVVVLHLLCYIPYGEAINRGGVYRDGVELSSKVSAWELVGPLLVGPLLGGLLLVLTAGAEMLCTTVALRRRCGGGEQRELGAEAADALRWPEGAGVGGAGRGLEPSAGQRRGQQGEQGCPGDYGPGGALPIIPGEGRDRMLYDRAQVGDCDHQVQRSCRRSGGAGRPRQGGARCLQVTAAERTKGV